MSILSDDLYLDNIKEYVLDENRIVTYKWLSRILSVPVTAAKKMLMTFVHKAASESIDITVLYVVTGKTLDHNPNVKVMLLDEASLQESLCVFDEVWTTHIYSVQRALPKDISMLYSSDYNCVNRSPYQQWNMIDYPVAVDIKKMNDKVVESPPSDNKPIDAVKTSPCTNSAAIERKKAQGTSSDTHHTASFKSDKKTTNKVNKIDTKKMKTQKNPPRKSKQINFGKDNAKKQILPATVTSQTDTANEKMELSIQNKTCNTIKPSLKKRKRIRDISSSSDSDDNDNEKMKSTTTTTTTTTSSSGSSGIHTATTGTAGINTGTAGIGTAGINTGLTGIGTAGSSNTRRRKRIKKLVDKMFINEDGSMVTKKHWEDVSTDASSDDGRTITAKANALSNKIKPPSKTNKKQSNIKSFFKK